MGKPGLEHQGIGRLRDEIDGTQGHAVLDGGARALPGEDQDLHAGVEGEELTDQCEALLGAVRGGWQSEIDERQRRHRAEGAQ
jgi:hypothetical protein